MYADKCKACGNHAVVETGHGKLCLNCGATVEINEEKPLSE
jgi:methionyl-tRNA synthetase